MAIVVQPPSGAGILAVVGLAAVGLAFGPEDTAEAVLDSLPSPVFTLDDGDRFSSVNDAFADVFEAPPGALTGKHLSVVFREAAGERLADLAAEARADADAGSDGRVATVTVPVGDGDSREVEVRLRPLVDRPGWFVGVVRDVTGRSARDRELERYERIVETIGDPVYVADPGGTILFVNEAMAAVTGYPREMLVDGTLNTVFATADVRAVEALLAEVVEDEDRIQAVREVELVTRDGERTTVENKMTLLPHDGEYRGHAGVMRDVSDRKRREVELERYGTIVDALGDPVFTVEPDGTVSFVNEAFEETLDRSPAAVEAGEVDLVDVVAPESVDRVRSVVRDLEGGDTETLETHLVADDGRTIPFETNVAALPGDGEDGFGGTANVARDVTGRKEREQRLAVLNRVFRHDIRNKLSVVESGATYLADELAGELRDEARRVERAARSIERTSDQAYSIGRLLETDRERETVDLVEAVASIADHFARENPEADVRRDHPESVTVLAMPALDFAVWNLVENAIEHNPEPTPTVSLVVECDGDDVHLHVDDDGPGIPRHETRVLKTETEDPMTHSSGLGLWAVNWIVQRSHGDLAFDESPLGGARVTLTFHRA
jgi:PAS domain S-box-containing protein